jgi:hypothetical protein
MPVILSGINLKMYTEFSNFQSICVSEQGTSEKIPIANNQSLSYQRFSIGLRRPCYYYNIPFASPPVAYFPSATDVSNVSAISLLLPSLLLLA